MIKEINLRRNESRSGCATLVESQLKVAEKYFCWQVRTKIIFSMNFAITRSVTRCYQTNGVRHASWIKSIFTVDKNEPPYGHCVQIGDPVLRKIADKVPEELIKTPEIKFLVEQMKQVLENFSLVGLAAPQIGISLRVFLMSFPEHLKTKKYKPEVYKAKGMSTFPFTVFINPEIKVVDHKKVIFEEGCASVNSFAADVARNLSVLVRATNLEGEQFEHTFTGWNARIAQHENDHLNGILFTDLMERKTLRCTQWEMVNQKSGRIAIPYYPKKWNLALKLHS